MWKIASYLLSSMLDSESYHHNLCIEILYTTATLVLCYWKSYCSNESCNKLLMPVIITNLCCLHHQLSVDFARTVSMLEGRVSVMDADLAS